MLHSRSVLLFFTEKKNPAVVYNTGQYIVEEFWDEVKNLATIPVALKILKA